MDVIERNRAATLDVRIPTTARELVEWTYAIQRAHRGGNPEAGGAAISQTGLVIERMRLGRSIDGRGGGNSWFGALHCHEDALSLHHRIESYPAVERGLIIRHGELRSMPDWQPLIMPLRVLPAPGRKGKPKGIYAHAGKTQIGCELIYEGDLPTRSAARAHREAFPDGPVLRCAEEIIEHARRTYRLWWNSLEALANWLEDWPLKRWRIREIGAPCRPWAD